MYQTQYSKSIFRLRFGLSIHVSRINISSRRENLVPWELYYKTNYSCKGSFFRLSYVEFFLRIINTIIDHTFHFSSFFQMKRLKLDVIHVILYLNILLVFAESNGNFSDIAIAKPHAKGKKFLNIFELFK